MPKLEWAAALLLLSENQPRSSCGRLIFALCLELHPLIEWFGDESRPHVRWRSEGNNRSHSHAHTWDPDSLGFSRPPLGISSGRIGTVAKLSARCPPHAQPWPSQVGSLFIVYVLIGGLLGFSYDLIHQQFIKVRALTAPLASGVCAVR